MQETKTVEINCASASWKNSDYCKGKNGEKRAALIVSRPGYLLGNELAHESFYKDFQIWIGDVIRPIGPSLKIE